MVLIQPHVSVIYTRVLFCFLHYLLYERGCRANQACLALAVVCCSCSLLNTRRFRLNAGTTRGLLAAGCEHVLRWVRAVRVCDGDDAVQGFVVAPTPDCS